MSDFGQGDVLVRGSSTLVLTRVDGRRVRGVLVRAEGRVSSSRSVEWPVDELSSWRLVTA